MLAQQQRGVRTRGRARSALLAVLSLALLAGLPSASAAQVITFSSATASWRDAVDNVPGSQPGDPVITNGVPTSSVSWGGAVPQSGYDVTITIPDPTQFPVANFTHRNFTVPDPSLTSITLDIVIDFEVDGVPLGPLTFTFTFTHEETPNNLDPCPYPTPPGEGCTDRVTFLDAPLPTTFTVGGKTYTLGLTFLDDMGNPVDEFITSEGGVANNADLDVEFALVPPVLEVTKTGPATLAPGEIGVFTIDAQNTGPNDAFETIISDLLPDGPTGGMCDATPQVLSAQVFAADGVTPAPGKGPLTQGTDFSFAYAAAPTCELTLSMLSAQSAVAENERLIIQYGTQLDGGTQFGVALTNVAGATSFFDDDVTNPGRTNYVQPLTDGTVGVVDHEDAHTVTTDPLDYLFEKTAVDPVTGLPLATAMPGDTIRYRLRLENRTTSPLAGLGFTDEIDRLNASPLFVPGSLTLVTVPVGADTSGTNPTGGAAGTGLVDVRNLSAAAGASVLVEYDVTLIDPILAGVLATNQADLLIADVPFNPSDDPGVNGAADPFVAGDEDPTVVTVVGTPDFRVEKVSTDLDGDPALLLAGERLRYTITVVNVGNADAVDATLRDAIPVNTTYVSDSTTLNGVAVADPAAGLAPFVGGMPIQALGAVAPGSMPADPAAGAASFATVIFEVVVDPSAVDGTVISNQAFVSAVSAGVVDQPSDDPDTPVPDDPTRDVVGGAPLLFAPKSVVIGTDNPPIGVVDPGDVLHYTIEVQNSGTAAATNVTLADLVPADTTYVADSVLLNGLPVGQPDGGTFPLIAGIPVSSADATPPLPAPGAGTVNPGQVATVEFDLLVNAGTPAGTLISNQAQVGSDQLGLTLTDGDGNPATGPEPTVVVVGAAQQLAITKQVSVVGGGAALPGAQVEYTVQVRNLATVPAQTVVITDDLDAPVAGQLAFVPGSETLNGLPAGIVIAGSLLTADYSGTYGPLAPGATIVLRFLATIDPGLATGTTVTNTGVVTWDTPPQTANASVSFDVGGMPGVAALNGTLWQDANFDRVVDPGETLLVGWTVEALRGGVVVQTVTSDAAGGYGLGGLIPNLIAGDPYTIRFRAPGAVATTASLGTPESPYTNGPQEITNVLLASGANLQGINLPIEPNGAVYDSLLRTPLSGATLRLLDAGTGTALPPACLDDPNQQGQVTLADGLYKFDLNFSDAACPSGAAYLISVVPPSSAYLAGASTTIPPNSDASTPPLSVPACPGSVNDAVPATATFCEAQVSAQPPPQSVPPATAGTTYHLHLLLDGSGPPGSSQIFNNHIPLDPETSGLIAITKTASFVNVSRGQQVPYVITFSNELAAGFPGLSIVDRFPTGFKYVKDSARLDGVPVEPEITGGELVWRDVGISASSRRQIVLLLAVGAAVSDGEFVNRAQAFDSATGDLLSGEARATVRVVPDPDFACTDVIGKVFDDANRNGVQERGEPGLQGVKLVTARGLIAKTDRYGRFHITCAVVPNERRGSNFVLKLDDRSLPSGYRLSTRQTQVKRATQGKALRFNWGATIHRVVGLDMADAVFEPSSTEMREQWKPRLRLLLEHLAASPSILRLSYVADLESERLVDRRLDAVTDWIEDAWEELDAYPLEIETEVFWRRGSPVELKAPAKGALPPVSSGPPGALPAVSSGPPSRETRTGASTERHLPVSPLPTQWTQDPALLESQAGDRLEEREVSRERVEIVKLTGVVPAIRFDSGNADISPSTIERLRSVLREMDDLRNVRLHLVGHADDQALSGALARKYGDNEGLSRERAGEVAEFLQATLALPPESISYEWAGASQPVASNDTAAGRARNRRVEVEVWYDEVEEETAIEEFVVQEDLKRVKVCRVETVCKLRYREGHAHRARIRNLVPPLSYGEDSMAIPDRFTREIREAMTNLADKPNLTVKLVGFTDDAPLQGRAERIYGTHLALSKARARRVSLAVREALDLASAEVESDGRGAARPLAGNDSVRGRALNNRIEVEFWHDDPLQELSDEPQLCPDAAAAETVTRVYEPPWGRIAPIRIEPGKAVVPPGTVEALQRGLGDIADKTNPRLRFVGYTGNERLDRRTALAYGDDIGLSASRARRVKKLMQGHLELADEQVEHEGRGYVHSNDVVNTGFLQDQGSYVAVEIVYDELALLDDRDGVEVTPITRELETRDPLDLNLMRITVDGIPVDDPGRSSQDVQRCTDVALEQADIQFRFDSLETEARLSVTAWPTSIRVGVTPENGLVAEPVRFRSWSNYGHFIARQEVRVFEEGAAVEEAEPLAVLPVGEDGEARWEPAPTRFRSPVRPLRFVLRAYDAEGRFDETAPQSLWMIYAEGPTEELVAKEEAAALAPALDELETRAETPRSEAVEAEARLLAGYGEAEPVRRNIPLDGSGTVRVQGSGVPDGHQVWLAGTRIPVDADGRFVAETVLPDGLHTVEVAVLDPRGNGELFLRDLELDQNDWLYVGIADLTFQARSKSGPADAFQGSDSTFDNDSWGDGRLAFFLSGEFWDGWQLTASADTREGEITELFDDFLDKSPDALFRRIDPDYHYSTYGDDSTVEQAAPTSGKLYLKVEKEQSHLMWGNFKVGYLQNELAQVDRGLYGGNLHYQTLATTSSGENRVVVDGFAAEPGTVASREEFRGTGGSLYYLRRQDLLIGSERVRIETRDKDSGLVSGVVHLEPNVDYDIDYFQGRILLSEPLSATANDGLLVRNQGLSGDEAYLVVQYEYSPSFDDLDALTYGGQGSFWLTDFAKVGVTASRNNEGTDSTLYGGDLTLRKSAESWLKLQFGRSEGLVSSTQTSNDGGFAFFDPTVLAPRDVDANAYRADLSIGLRDWVSFTKARLSVYAQRVEAGYSSPGLNTLRDTDQYGGRLDVPVFDGLQFSASADHVSEEDGLETTAADANVVWDFTDRWTVRGGMRHERREDDSAIVAATQREGNVTDLAMQIDYDSLGRWSAYGFGQASVQASGDRDSNHRFGLGGAFRVTEQMSFEGEASHGESGPALKVGTSFQESEYTRRYLSYVLENERGDDGLNARQGTVVNGVRSRLGDSGSVYREERFQHSKTSNGLTRSVGITLTPWDHWSMGANWEFGTIIDRRSSAETDRNAGGGSLGYTTDDIKFSTGVEYRHDDIEQTDGTHTRRTTWLFRNNIKYQITPSWRLLGKYNHSFSDSSEGDFFDGEYTEGVVGFAYRPVEHDKLNILGKYTYFYNMPTTEQVVLENTPVEFIQRSHIAAIDVSYEVTSWLTVGAKYAFRRGEISLDRENPDFFDNDAHLGIVRTDWRILRDWEIGAEGRTLYLPDLDERRTGGLTSLYYYFTDNFKAGVGYNFTNYSDDLTDLDYDDHGFFLNLVGSL